MTLSPFVFSNNPRYRVTRHVLFWTAWVAYYTIFMVLSWGEKYSFSTRFWESLVEESCSMPLDMAFCYSIIYFLIPRFLQKGHYVIMVLLWIFFSVLYVAIFRLYSGHLIPVIRGAFGIHIPISHHMSFMWDFFSLFSQINMEGCIAASIKIGKMWFIKQQDMELIQREKRKIEPQLEEGRMQPVFLLHALDRVETLSIKQPALVAGMVKRIKSLLLYVIYDNNQPSVGLGKELKLLEEYVELEKAGESQLKVNVRITGNPAGERIAPFIILPLVENGFRQLSMYDLPARTLDLEIRIADGAMQLRLGWSKPIDSSTLGNGGSAFLQHIGKRLELLYPQSHELKVVITTEQFAIDLRIELHRGIG